MKKIVFLVCNIVYLFGFNAYLEYDKATFVFDEISLKNGVYKDEIIKCSPSLKGIYEVEKNALNEKYTRENKITFYANEPLKLSTTYKCVFDNKTYEFKTNDFGINFISKNNNNYLVEFNSEVDIKDFKQNIETNVNYEVNKIAANKFEILLKENAEIKIKKTLKDIFGNTLKSDFGYQKSTNYIPNKNETKTLSKEQIQAISKNNKTLGFKITYKDLDCEYFCNTYMPNDSIIIDGVSHFNISYANYDYKTKETFVEITSKEFKPNTTYLITLKAPFGIKNNHLIKDDFSFTLKTLNYKPTLSFSDNLPYISSKGKIQITSTNVNEIKATLSKISDENYRYFINYYNDSSVTEVIKEAKFSIDNELNKETKTQIDLNLNDMKDGVYKLELSYDKTKISKVLYISDIAINAKVSNDSIFVFTNRLSANEVLKNAKITIFSDKNKIISNGYTNDLGVFEIKEKNLIKKKPKSILVEYKNEKNFLILDGAYEKNINNKKALVYLASEILRPNDELQGIVILKDNYKSIKNLPIKLELFNPENKKILSKNYTLDEFGTIKFSNNALKLNGKYTLRIIFENKIIASKSFNVESFTPQGIKNYINFDKEYYHLDDVIFVELGANYLFGAPASNLSGEFISTITNKRFSPKGYENYSFTNEIDDFNKVLYSQNYEINLDENAKANKILKAAKIFNPASILSLNTTFILNENGKNVAVYQQKNIYPYKNMIGIASDKEIYQKNEKIKLNYISLNPINLEKTSTNISASLYKINYAYNYICYDSCSISWNKELVKIKDFDNLQNNLSIDGLLAGNYLLIAKDKSSNHQASINFSVAGYDFGNIPTNDLAKAHIKLDKASYKKGDIINAQITSPLKNALMLVSLEDSSVIDYKIINIDNYSSNVSFEIKNDFNGMYLNASILRVSDKPSVFMPFKAVAKEYINKNNDEHKLNINLKTKNQISSNENLNVLINSLPNSKIYLFAVDEGILQIINQKSPDVFKYFNQQTPSKIDNFDIYEQLTNYVNSGKVLSFGSDEMLSNAMKKYQDPNMNDDSNNFIKMLDGITNNDGIAEFSIQIPNNLNTKIKLFAISLNDDKISSTTDEVIVKDDLFIKFANVKYLLKGDNIEFPINIFNNTNKDLDITLNYESSQNIDILNESNIVNIKANSNKLVNINLNALDVGDGFISIINNLNNNKHNFKLSILNPNPEIIKTLSSGLIDKQTNIKLKDVKEIKLNISGDILANYGNYFAELDNNIYNIDSISSKLIALALSNMPLKDVFINDNLIKLSVMQNTNGVFNTYQEVNKYDEKSSLYAIHTLLIMKELGYYVDELVIKKAMEYIKNNISLNTYATFILSKANELDISSINAILDKNKYKENAHSYVMMAAMLKKLNKLEAMEKILNELKNDTQIFSNEDKALALYVYLENFSNDDFAQKITNDLMNQTLKQNKEKAFFLLAISKTEQKQNPSYTVINGDDEYELNGANTLNIKLYDDTISIIPKNNDKLYHSITTSVSEEIEIKHLKDIIYREFLDSNGNLVDLNNLKLNDLIFSKITIDSKTLQKDLIIHEKVPSCFEIINETIVQNIRNNKFQDTLKATFDHVNDYSITRYFDDFIQKGVIYTPLKVVLKGTCKLPAVTISKTNSDELNDYDLESLNINIH